MMRSFGAETPDLGASVAVVAVAVAAPRAPPMSTLYSPARLSSWRGADRRVETLARMARLLPALHIPEHHITAHAPCCARHVPCELRRAICECAVRACVTCNIMKLL